MTSRPAPTYYWESTQQYVTMLGTQTDISGKEANVNSYWKPINDTGTFPSVDEVTGEFEVFNENRQVRPFLFTTYSRLLPPKDGSIDDTAAVGSGSCVAISQSDGTPFGLLRMYQIQQPAVLAPISPTAYAITCTVAPVSGFCSVTYYDTNNEEETISFAGTTIICGYGKTTDRTVLINSQTVGLVTVPNENLNGASNPCRISVDDQPSAARPGDGDLTDTNVNEYPMFYQFSYTNNGISVGSNTDGSYNIPYGEAFDGLNTSSLSLTTGTQPAGNTENAQIVFPQGNYIFTMSDFDTGRWAGGRTEFGLWTTYGDYSTYNLKNEVGSNANPVTINYIDDNYNNTSIDVFQYALLTTDGITGNLGNIPITTDTQDNGGTNQGDGINIESSVPPNTTKYRRFNIKADGDYNARWSRITTENNKIEVYILPNQNNTGPTPPASQYYVASGLGILPESDISSYLTGLTNVQQILFQFINTSTVSYHTLRISGIYNKSLPNASSIPALVGSPTAVEPFTDPFVVTGSISFRYANGAAVPGRFKTKVVDAYVVYSSSLSSSLDGAYEFSTPPTFGKLSVTASVLVSSFTDTGAALYGNAIYGDDEYGGAGGGGGTTWTTASIILYTGSAINFPDNMPSLGGNIFAETSSESLTHHTGERITLMAELNSGDLKFRDVVKMALRVGSGSDSPSVVQNGLVVTEYSMSFSSSIDINDDPSIPTVYSDDLNFDKALDCQPLLNNYSNGRLNNRLQDVDYGFGTVIPSNWQQIIDFSASKASVPESNYTIRASSNPRYYGTKSTTETLNEWGPGDTGTYGKLPNVEVSRAYLAYFNKAIDLYPLLNNSTQYNIQYLISQDGTATQPKLSDITLYNIQGTFNSYPNVPKGTVSLNNVDNSSFNILNGPVTFQSVTRKPVPIIYTQQSNLFPSMTFLGAGDDAAYTGSGIELIGDQPVDPTIVPTFANYSTLAQDNGSLISTGEFGPATFKSANRDPVSNTTPNVTASFIPSNGDPAIDVYDTDPSNGGILTIPNTDGYPTLPAAGNGKATSQPYTLTMELGIDTSPLTYAIQTSNSSKNGGFNTEVNVGSLNIKFKRAENLSETFNTYAIPSSAYKVTLVSYIVSVQGSGFQNITTDYRSIAQSSISSTGNGITINYNTNTILQTLPSSQNTAVKLGGSLAKQRWLVEVTIPSTAIRQGQRWRIDASGNMISPTAQERNQDLDPQFFPNDAQGGFQYKVALQGAESNPVTAALPPYWNFADSANEVGNTDLSGGSGYTTGTNVGTSTDSAEGGGATINILTVDGNGPLTTTLVGGGSGYSTANGVGTDVTPTGGSGATVDITGVAAGIYPINVTTAGTTYTVDTTFGTSTTGAGSGATVKVTGVNAGGGVTAAEIVEYGSGYSDGDVLTLTGGDSAATVTIGTITGTGAILSAGYSVAAQGTGYTVDDVLTIVQGANSTATIKITSIAASGAILTYNIASGGTDYAEGDVLTINNNVGGGVSNATLTVTSLNAGGNVISDTLVCVSDQLNKGYGRGFVQQDLIYTSSLNRNFPDGVEPGYTTFPSIQNTWDLQPYDEIRFQGDESQTYRITEIISPANNTGDAQGQLQITLDRSVPVSFNTFRQSTSAGIGVALDTQATSSQTVAVATAGGSDDILQPDKTSTPQLVQTEFPDQIFRPLDFFVIRRYVDDASSLITFQQYPYTNPPTTASATGFILPQYPISKLKINPDEILSDLVDKKLIE